MAEYDRVCSAAAGVPVKNKQRGAKPGHGYLDITQ